MNYLDTVRHGPSDTVGCIVAVGQRRVEIMPRGFDIDTWTETIIVDQDDCDQVELDIDGSEIVVVDDRTPSLGAAISASSKSHGR